MHDKTFVGSLRNRAMAYGTFFGPLRNGATHEKTFFGALPNGAMHDKTFFCSLRNGAMACATFSCLWSGGGIYAKTSICAFRIGEMLKQTFLGRWSGSQVCQNVSLWPLGRVGMGGDLFRKPFLQPPLTMSSCGEASSPGPRTERRTGGALKHSPTQEKPHARGPGVAVRNLVGQAFQPVEPTGGWKAPKTGGLERLPYGAENPAWFYFVTSCWARRDQSEDGGCCHRRWRR